MKVLLLLGITVLMAVVGKFGSSFALDRIVPEVEYVEAGENATSMEKFHAAIRQSGKSSRRYIKIKEQSYIGGGVGALVGLIAGAILLGVRGKRVKTNQESTHSATTNSKEV